MSNFKSRPYPPPGRRPLSSDQLRAKMEPIAAGLTAIAELIDQLEASALSVRDAEHCRYMRGVTEEIRIALRGHVRDYLEKTKLDIFSS